MKRVLTLVLFLTVITNSFAQVYYSPSDIPNPKDHGDGFVSDPDDFLLPDEEAKLDTIITRLRDEKGFEIAVIIVNSIGEKAPHPFATDLGNLWEVGKGDRGIIILAAIQDRNMAIATGYETEQYIPALLTQEIQVEELKPYFKLEQYGKGLIAAVEVIEAIVMEDNVPEYVERTQEKQKNLIIWEYISMAVAGILILLTIILSPTLKTVLTNLIIVAAAIAVALIAYFVFLKESYTADIIRDGAVILGFIGITVNAFIVAKNETDKIWPYGILITCVVGVPLYGLHLYGYHAIVFFYLIGAGVIFGAFLFTYTLTLFIKDPYNKFHTLKVFKLDVFAYVFPFPMFITDLFVENLLESWRNRVRFSKKTGLEMRKLSEKDDDEFLKKGQVSEEKVKSVDYDVWITDEPGDILILKYTTWFSKYSTCSRCKFKTWYLVYDKTISSATYSSSGTGEKKKACANCGHQSITRYTIPRKTRSSSSSSGGGSFSSSGGGSFGGSGGGSFGGGSFGGGGSSSSW